jgi:hypothetical protein
MPQAKPKPASHGRIDGSNMVIDKLPQDFRELAYSFCSSLPWTNLPNNIPGILWIKLKADGHLRDVKESLKRRKHAGLSHYSKQSLGSVALLKSETTSKLTDM